MLKSENFYPKTGRFYNSDSSENKKSPSQLFKMVRAFFTRAKDPLEDTGFDMLTPAGQPDSPTGRQVTWIGHSNLLVSINGKHILTDLTPKQTVAIHWGTFKLTLEPLDEPPVRLAAALRAAEIDATRFLALQHGQKLNLD